MLPAGITGKLVMNKKALQLLILFTISVLSMTAHAYDGIDAISSATSYSPPALHQAVMHAKYKNVEALLRKGHSIDEKDEDGNSPFHVMIRDSFGKDEQVEIAKFLIQHGANVNIKNSTGLTPIYFAIATLNKKLIKHLIKNGANINHIDNYGRTPLHIAADTYKELVEIIINSGAKVNARDNDGFTPLHVAADEAGTEHDVIEYLLQKGAEVNAVNKAKETPLHLVSGRILKDIALLKNGANVNAIDRNGNTPLHIRVDNTAKYIDNTYEKVVAYMLKLGANPKLKNMAGKTAIDIAKARGHKRIAKILEK